jgi:hypothetical protein
MCSLIVGRTLARNVPSSLGGMSSKEVPHDALRVAEVAAVHRHGNVEIGRTALPQIQTPYDEN